MNNLQTFPLPRKEIADFIPSPRGVRAFEAAQQDIANQYDVLTTAQFLTLDAEPNLGAERIFTPVSGDLVGTDGGANSPYTLGLAATTVVAGSYGDASHSVKVTVDAKGRLTGVVPYVLTTTNIIEGTNLYYTDARARAALSGSSGIAYNSATGAFTAAQAGTYGAPTGTLSRSTFATYTAATVSNPPTQSEVQAIANAVQTVSRTLAALITDLRANGNLA